MTQLHIRLNKGPSAPDLAGAGGLVSPATADTVTVACPDHLVLADLPVAKSLGALTAAAANSSPSVGRRSRRNLGQKVHFCVRCDFPIAIYGRLSPCEHAFCLACSRSEACCYLCEERVQKIQTIKLMEGIFLCAAPHCLKSFLKITDFETHISENHADLLHPNAEREGGNESDAMNVDTMNTTRQSSVDPHKQSSQPESSTAHGPARPAFSNSTNLQLQDRDERARRNQSQPSPRPPQPRPPPYPSRPQQQGDQQSENNPPQGSDKQTWFQLPQNSESQNGRRDADQISQGKQAGIPQDPAFMNYSSHPPQPPNYPHPMSGNQVLISAPFTYPSFPTDGSQTYYTVPFEMPRTNMVQDGGSEQVSVIGVPPPPTAMPSFQDNAPRPWAGMTMMGVPFAPMQLGQGFSDSFMNQGDVQGGMQFYQGIDYSRLQEGMTMNPTFSGKESEQQVGAQMSMQLPVGMQPMLPPPPPTMPRPMSQQVSSNNSSSGGMGHEGQAFGWPTDNRGFGNA